MWEWLRRRRCARAVRSWADIPLADLTCTVLDCETTGLNPAADALVAVAAVRVVGGQVTSDELSSLVNPGRPIPERATAIHGLDDAAVATAPAPHDAVSALRDFVADDLVVGQLVAFDLAFLDSVNDGPAFPPALDTLLMSIVLWPGQEVRHNLSALAARLHVAEVDRHTARGDALMTAQCLVAMVPLLEARGLATVGAVVRACERTRRARHIARRYRTRAEFSGQRRSA